MQQHKFVVAALAFAVVALASPLLAAGSPVAAGPPDAANDVQQQPPEARRTTHAIREDELMQKLNAKCGADDVSSCVMLKLVTYMNRLMKKNSVEFGDAVEIVAKPPNPEDEQQEDAEDDRPAEEEDSSAGRAAAAGSDEAAFGRIMADKVWRYAQTRALRFRVLPEADFVVSASPAGDGSLDFGMSLRSGKDLESGRGKNKNMGPMMAAMMMKMGMLKVMAFKVLALLVGKALFVSKLAFILAVLIGLKKLFSQQKHVTYEVVAHPHHESHHHGGGGDSYSSAGWGRSSSEAAHSLAYSGQTAP